MWNNRKIVSCACFAASLFLTGCSKQSDELVSLKPSKTEENNLEEAKLPESYTTTLPEKKEESVTVKADAYGNPKSTSVEVSLSGISGDGYVEDQTILTDLRNTKGAEEYYLLEDGRLVWDNLNEAITYKGKTEEPLPVGVHLAYFLDGKGISPEELAGKSGHIEIDITYENRTHSSAIIDGKAYDLPIPFMTITLIPLGDNFTNVKTENGKVISTADTNAVIGFAVPGLQNSLRLTNYEVTKDLDLPESIKIEADVTNFELGFTTTIISSGLFEDVEEDDLNDVNDLTNDMNKLSDASGELVDGTQELYDGMKEFQDYLVQYNDGIGKVGDGIKALKDGLRTIDGYSDDMNKGITALSDGLNQLNTGLANLDISKLYPSEPSEMEQVEQAMEDIPVQERELRSSINNLTDARNEMNRFYGAALQYQDNITETLTKIEALKTSITSTALTPQEETVVKTALMNAGKSSDATEAFIDAYKSIPNNLDEIKQLLSSETIKPPALDNQKVENAINALTPSIQNLTKDLEVLQSFITSIQTGIVQIEGLPEMVTGLKTGVAALVEGSKQLKTGMNAYTDGVSKLYDGASQLSDGAGQLPEAGGKLSDGYTSILDGVWSLTEGVKKFDQEGIKELTKLGGSNLQDIVRRVKALHRVEETYTNYSGIPEGVKGSVRFMIETEEIKAFKE